MKTGNQSEDSTNESQNASGSAVYRMIRAAYVNAARPLLRRLPTKLRKVMVLDLLVGIPRHERDDIRTVHIDLIEEQAVPVVPSTPEEFLELAKLKALLMDRPARH